MGRKIWLGLAGWLLLCYGAAVVGGQFSPGPWYERLDKPAWTPPGAVFGPVWALLYTLMAVAAWLVWKERGFRRGRAPLVLFLVQLALNVAWSALFFGARQPGLAMLDLALLWLAILATLIAFWRVRPIAGALLLPYLLWVTYAGSLNFAIWWLNA